MPEKKMRVEWEDGANLSQSRKKPGAYSPLTRDGDNNLGHVILSDVDDDEYNWNTEPEPEPERRWYINERGEPPDAVTIEIVWRRPSAVALGAEQRT